MRKHEITCRIEEKEISQEELMRYTEAFYITILKKDMARNGLTNEEKLEIMDQLIRKLS